MSGNSGTESVNVRHARISVTPRSDCVSFEGACKEAARERGPRDDAHTKVAQCGEHLALFFTVYKRVVILHRDERREIVCNRVIYKFSPQQHVQRLGVGYSLCMTWTEPTVSELVAGVRVDEHLHCQA